MALARTKTAPLNSIVVVEDYGGGMIPETITPGSLIAFTDSCVAVGCQSELDGQTEFMLGDAAEADPGYRPIFEGKLQTPSHKIVLQSVYNQILLEKVVPGSETSVRIWVSDSTEPDVVIVGIV